MGSEEIVANFPLGTIVKFTVGGGINPITQKYGWIEEIGVVVGYWDSEHEAVDEDGGYFVPITHDLEVQSKSGIFIRGTHEVEKVKEALVE